MTYLNNNTNRNNKGRHLSEKEMILIEVYKGEGYSNRQIAKKCLWQVLFGSFHC